MQLIRPRFGDDVNHRARVTADVGAVEVGLDLELTHRIDRRPKGERKREALIVINTVIKKVIVAFAVTVGKDLVAGAAVVRARAAHDGSGGGFSHAIYSGTERRQLDEVAAIQRQLVHQLPVDHRSHRRRLGFQERRMASHVYRFSRLTYLKRQVHTSLLVDLENYAGLLQLAEAGRFAVRV